MKKILIILCLLIVLSSCNVTSKSEFENLLSNYPHNSDYLKEYELEFNQSKNIVYAINKVNYPNFLTPRSSQYLAFKTNNVWLVNTNYRLSSGYVPKDLIKVENVDYIKRENQQMLINNKAFDAYKKLYEASLLENLELMIFSAYRSYEYQENLYKKEDNNYVAQPGASEHQTGMAIDIATPSTGLTNHFDNTPEAKWLENNAYKFGFIQRYPKDKEHITGYPYESWHYTFVGESVAENIKSKNITLEEYLYQYILL